MCVQVDTLVAQVAELNEQVKDMPALQSALEKAKREQAEAEQKLHVAVHENQQIQQQARAQLLKPGCNACCDCAKLALGAVTLCSCTWQLDNNSNRLVYFPIDAAMRV